MSSSGVPEAAAFPLTLGPIMVVVGGVIIIIKVNRKKSKNMTNILGWKTFKKTFPFLCSDCGEFLQSEMEYCENCGAHAVRKVTNDDYLRYKNEKEVANEKNKEK